LSHDREDRVGRADHSEKVYVEQRLRLVHRRFFSFGKQGRSPRCSPERRSCQSYHCAFSEYLVAGLEYGLRQSWERLTRHIPEGRR
jgi:hypothetical protein